MTITNDLELNFVRALNLLLAAPQLAPLHIALTIAIFVTELKAVGIDFSDFLQSANLHENVTEVIKQHVAVLVALNKNVGLPEGKLDFDKMGI